MKFSYATFAIALSLLAGCASSTVSETGARNKSGVEVFGTIDAAVSGRR